jgi:hypothetical protein
MRKQYCGKGNKDHYTSEIRRSSKEELLTKDGQGCRHRRGGANVAIGVELGVAALLVAPRYSRTQPPCARWLPLPRAPLVQSSSSFFARRITCPRTTAERRSAQVQIETRTSQTAGVAARPQLNHATSRACATGPRCVPPEPRCSSSPFQSHHRPPPRTLQLRVLPEASRPLPFRL